MSRLGAYIDKCLIIKYTVKSPKFGRNFSFKIELKIGGLSDQKCNYSLITGKTVACIGEVDTSTLPLQATYFFGKVGGRT